MKTNLFFILLVAFASSCSVKPQPLNYSVDNCHFCKMTLADDKFGGELVTSKGKVFKFDDIKCMISFLNSAEGKKFEYEYQLVADYGHNADEFNLIDVSSAFYLSSSNLQSPMGGNVAAFKYEESLKEYLKNGGGSVLTWAEVKSMFK